MSITGTPSDTWLGLKSAGILMSPAEFDAATDYDESYRFEILHGVLVVTPNANGLLDTRRSNAGREHNE